MTLIAGSSSRSTGLVVSSSLPTSTERGFARSRTSTRRKHSSTPARRASCDCHVSIRSAACVPTIPRPIRPTLRGLEAIGAILPAVTLVLREADVERVIQMDPVIAAVEAAMRELGSGVAQNEPRRRAFAPGGLLNVMFASYPGGGCTGLKAYTVAAGRARFLVVQFALDGSLQALIEADLMGAYRTGAAGLRSRPRPPSCVCGRAGTPAWHSGHRCTERRGRRTRRGRRGHDHHELGASARGVVGGESRIGGGRRLELSESNGGPGRAADHGAVSGGRSEGSGSARERRSD